MKKKIFLLFILALTLTSCSNIIRWRWNLRGISEEGRRGTFENTKSYNEGKEQDLIRYRLQYLQAETELDKEAIASTVRMMFADYDDSMLNPELKQFLNEVRYK